MERRNILTGLGAIAGAAAATVVQPASAAQSSPKSSAIPPKGATMKAALMHGKEDLRVVKIPVPAPGPDDVIVRVVCYAPYGTDLGIYRSGLGKEKSPVGIGADFSGLSHITEQRFEQFGAERFSHHFTDGI